MGDQLARTPNEENIEKAEHEYRDAVDLAKQLATSEPDNMKRQQQLIFALNKVGDMRQLDAIGREPWSNITRDCELPDRLP